MFQGTCRVYKLPEDGSEPPPRMLSIQSRSSSRVDDCIVRVYLVRATGLQPSDYNGLADPYVEVELGETVVDTQEHYVPNTLNPIFGR